MFVDVTILSDDVDLVVPDADEDVGDVDAYIAFVEDHGLVCTEKVVEGDTVNLIFEEGR